MHTHTKQRVHTSQDQKVPASITALKAGAQFQELYPGTILAEPDSKGKIPFVDLPTDRFQPETKCFTVPMVNKSEKQLAMMAMKVLKMSDIKTMLSLHGTNWEILKTELTAPEGLFTEGKFVVHATEINTALKLGVREGLEGILGHIREASPKLKKQGFRYEAVITEISNGVQLGSLDAYVLAQVRNLKAVVRKATSVAIEFSKLTKTRTRAMASLSSYQGDSSKLRLGLVIRVDIAGINADGQTDEMRLLVETENFTVVREDSLRFYFDTKKAKPKAEDALAIAIRGMTSPDTSLQSQSRVYPLRGLPATAKTIKNAVLHAQYEGSTDNIWRETTQLTEGPDAGTFKHAIGTDAAYASENAKEIFGIIARLAVYGMKPSRNMIDGRFHDSAPNAANNAYFSAGIFGHPTIHTGRGKGGKDGLIYNISDDNDVIRHESHHMVQWLIVPGGNYPADLHEGGADVGAKLTLLEVMAEDGELEAAGADFIRDNRWKVGAYAAGDLEDKSGHKRGELRNLKDVVSVNIQTNDPHKKGLASGGSEMRHYTHYMIGRAGVSITQGLKDSRACYMYLRKSSKGDKTTAQDLLRSALAFDRKTFNGANVEEIRQAYKVSDITVNDLHTPEATRAHIAKCVAERKAA